MYPLRCKRILLKHFYIYMNYALEVLKKCKNYASEYGVLSFIPKTLSRFKS